MTKATKELAVGQEIPSLTRQVTLEKMKLYSGWPWKNIHTDDDLAKSTWLPRAILQGLQSHAYVSKMLTDFFGEGWLKGGKLEVTFIQYGLPGDTVTCKGIVRERKAEGEAVRCTLEVWCENQRGEKITVGTASALVR